ncbi:hypothetical protein BCR33DRAFT_786029 [Rhizoclosmatium globosum]|uniref:DUF7928 domain-containing protein n=1 Tax=Rhizoclosmatium globosum TaxID=329046 RepID=A0A1Y2C8E9_9FUNG|nr:hypothetical protein BCR33DRAFT_786029 [Rhizoclosmatium globosum]|eukprot:ORY43177.1 hypothetical protein BCR33DRAFT_786029 [Rhizoclosmatium globosum]
MDEEEIVDPRMSTSNDRSSDALAVAKKLYEMLEIEGNAIICHEAIQVADTWAYSSKMNTNNPDVFDEIASSPSISAPNLSPSSGYLGDASISSDNTESSDTALLAIHCAVWPPRSNQTLSNVISGIFCKVAILIEGDSTIAAVIRRVPSVSNVVIMPNGDKLQLFESMDAMATGNICRLQWAAFLRKEKALLIWADDINALIDRFDQISLDLFKKLDIDSSFLVCNADNPRTTEPYNFLEKDSDPERLETRVPRRQPVYWSLIITTIALGLNIVFNFSTIGDLIGDFLVDGNYWRFFYLIMIPIGIFLAQFFFQVLVGLGD